MFSPYYADDYVKLFHADAVDWLSALDDGRGLAALVTDPPYGIAYNSGHNGILPRSIVGDDDTSLRDWAVDWAVAHNLPALVFGTWRVPRPEATRQVLIWDTKGALGMGALDLPWKPSHQEVYVIGSGFEGHRGTDVLRYAPVQSQASNGRVHPHEKPVSLMRDLISKCPQGAILDPFCGSGATLEAAKALGRKAVGIEIEERYCEVAADRLSQGVLLMGVDL